MSEITLPPVNIRMNAPTVLRGNTVACLFRANGFLKRPELVLVIRPPQRPTEGDVRGEALQQVQIKAVEAARRVLDVAPELGPMTEWYSVWAVSEACSV